MKGEKKKRRKKVHDSKGGNREERSKGGPSFVRGGGEGVRKVHLSSIRVRKDAVPMALMRRWAGRCVGARAAMRPKGGCPKG